MLDRGETTTKLRTNLMLAFRQWEKQDRVRHTKAEFARQCATLAGRACSPQTVSGWFKTGRMDKSWLPIVEEILGTALGFGSAHQLVLPDITQRPPPATWPFELLDYDKLTRLTKDDALRLEGAILQSAGQLQLDVQSPRTGKQEAA